MEEETNKDTKKMDSKTEEVTSSNETETHAGVETGAEDEVEILDRNVAKTVMGVLHCYYPDAQDIRKELQKKKEWRLERT